MDALNELTGKAAVRKYITSRTPKAAAKKFPSIVKKIISRAQVYPLNKCVGRDAAVKHITDLLESTSEQRLKRLKDAHVYRSDSSFCKAYINKTTAAYLEEVIGTMEISSYSSIMAITWSNNRISFESSFKTYVERDGMSWGKALNKTLMQSVIHPTVIAGIGMMTTDDHCTTLKKMLRTCARLRGK